MEINNTSVFDAYQLWTDTVAQYPATSEPEYLVLGMVDEIGELIEKGDIMAGPSETILELGDSSWYVGRYAYRVLGVSLCSLVMRAEAQPTITERRVMRALGTIAGIEKKRIRDGDSWNAEKIVNMNDRAEMKLIEIVAFLMQQSRSFGCTLEDVITVNRTKLDDRKSRNVIKGEGDKR